MTPRSNGAVIYRGPSMIDNATGVVAIATGLKRPSDNRKTGDMVQTWILRDDVTPLDAAANREDAAICGGCPFRRQPNGHRACYVNVGQAPQGIYGAFSKGGYPTVSLAYLPELFAGRLVRLGAYGDPAAIPIEVWDAVLSKSAGHTGYTHQWKSKRLRAVTKYAQASVDNAADVQQATALGLGYFRVKPVDAPMLDGETYCPANGTDVTCASCQACNGTGARVVIDAHGSGAKYV